MRYFHDCGGIHAAGVAFDDLGWECVGMTEIDKFPIAVVNHHFPKTVQYGDTTKVKAKDVPPIDLLIGGTPCQGFSLAGNREGMDDDRSALARNFLRLASELNPRWFIWENVPGTRSANEGRDLLAFAQKVEELGYRGGWRTLDAQYFGVPQQRSRIFFVGYFGDWRPAAAVLFERHSLRGIVKPRTKKEAPIARAISTSSGGASAKEQQCTSIAGNVPLNALYGGQQSERVVAPPYLGHHNRYDYDTEGFVVEVFENHGQDSRVKKVSVSPQINAKAGTGGTNLPLVMRTIPINGMVIGKEAKDGDRQTTGIGEPGEKMFTIRAASNQHAVYYEDRVRTLTPLEVERLMGFPDYYTRIPWKGKPAELCPDSPRLKALGNSIVTYVLRHLGCRICEVERIMRELA